MSPSCAAPAVPTITTTTTGDGSRRLAAGPARRHGAAYFAAMYRRDRLYGGHVIMLGSGNEVAACEALAAWPDAMQLGGSITADTAAAWLARGAAKVIVTSWLFPEARYCADRARALAHRVGRDRIVVDLSCRRRQPRPEARSEPAWVVATNRWQTLTDTVLSAKTLHAIAPYASEFLVHAADVEGLCSGIDEALVRALAQWSPIPCTYAGGGRGSAARGAARSPGA